MNTKQRLLDLLAKRRHNQDHNVHEMTVELGHRKTLPYSSVEFKRLALSRAQEAIEKYTAEVMETDAMIALVQRHCPEEP